MVYGFVRVVLVVYMPIYFCRKRAYIGINIKQNTSTTMNPLFKNTDPRQVQIRQHVCNEADAKRAADALLLEGRRVFVRRPGTLCYDHLVEIMILDEQVSVVDSHDNCFALALTETFFVEAGEVDNRPF